MSSPLNLIIFDWDDTLLPTSYLTSRNQVDEEVLGQIADKVSELLLLASRIGHVVIITNGAKGWIETSCQEFAPTGSRNAMDGWRKLMTALENLPKLSARHSHEHECQRRGEGPICWKTLAFQSYVVNRLKNVPIEQIIAVGDGEAELLAAQELHKVLKRKEAYKQNNAFNGARGSGGVAGPDVGEHNVEALDAVGQNSSNMVKLKTVRFQQNVNPQELHKELRVLSSNFLSIVAKPNDYRGAIGAKPARQREGSQVLQQ